MLKRISQKVKLGASSAGQMMLETAEQTMKTNEDFMLTYLHIPVLTVVKLISAVWNLIMFAELKPIVLQH